jgi:hypothetical protein
MKAVAEAADRDPRTVSRNWRNIQAAEPLPDKSAIWCLIGGSELNLGETIEPSRSYTMVQPIEVVEDGIERTMVDGRPNFSHFDDDDAERRWSVTCCALRGRPGRTEHNRATEQPMERPSSVPVVPVVSPLGGASIIMPVDRERRVDLQPKDGLRPESVIRASGAWSLPAAVSPPSGVEDARYGPRNAEWLGPAMDVRTDDLPEGFEGEIDGRPVYVRTCDLLLVMSSFGRYARETPAEPPPTT